MQINNISNQGFDGKVIGCSWFTPKQRKIFRQVRPCLENMVKNKDYDIKIYRYWGKTRIGDPQNPKYCEPSSDTTEIWINTAREYIKTRDKEK